MARQTRRETRSAKPVNPERYSAKTSANRIASLKFALDGCAYMLRYQKNSRILLAASLVVCPLAFWLGIRADQWAILILTIACVWAAEFINSAIEAAVNLSVSGIHPMARVAKDVAAAAVLIMAAAAALIGLLILGPPLLEWLNANAAAS